MLLYRHGRGHKRALTVLRQ